MVSYRVSISSLKLFFKNLGRLTKLYIVSSSLVVFIIAISFLYQVQNMSEATASSTESGTPTMLTRYRAAMVLSGAGDAIAYYQGKWEFCYSGLEIHEQLNKMGGIKKIDVSMKGSNGKIIWPVSDDTVMHLATAEAFVESGDTSDLEKIYYNIGKNYKECMNDMRGRAPGPTCIYGAQKWDPNWTKRQILHFDSRGGGCGAAMRAMCIGLRYPTEQELDSLIKVSIESGRMTHHHPTGYLGSLAAALFTSYCIQNKPIIEWGSSLVNDVLPKALQYIKDSKQYVTENVEAWDGEKGFLKYWQRYLRERKLESGTTQPKFPSKFDVKDRDIFYKHISFSGWGGSSGHDAPMIAYDSLLAAQNNWTELTNRAFFHAGDSDSTAVMAACWFGALYGFQGVPPSNYEGLEYQSRLLKSGQELYRLSKIESNVIYSVRSSTLWKKLN